MDQENLELNLETKNLDCETTKEFLVPMQSENFALALASGYIGGKLKDDAAIDLQADAGNGLLGFHGQVPSWAVSSGETGARVILSIDPLQSSDAEQGSMELRKGPMRVTRANRVYFEDDNARLNFEASYGPFPDIPVDLLDLVVEWPVNDQPEGDRRLGTAPLDGSTKRRDMDFLAGFSAGVIEILSKGFFDDQISRFLSDPGQGLGENAKRLLRALDPDASEVDLEIWGATLEALRSRFGKRGFDRLDFLAQLTQNLGEEKSEIAKWLNGCRQVIDGSIDIPSLDDGEHMGRRATLGIILSHEPSLLPALSRDYKPGSGVLALSVVAIYAFAGFSRLDKSLKSPSAKMNSVLEVAEHLLSGQGLQIAIITDRTDNDLTRVQTVKVGQAAALTRRVEPPPHLAMLKARIREAGYEVDVENESGRLGIIAGDGVEDPIIVENCDRSTAENPIVNLVLPITLLTARPTILHLKSYLEAARENATIVALRSVDGAEEIVAMASMPLSTLDRDELNFHVDGILRTAISLGGTKRRPRRVKK